MGRDPSRYLFVLACAILVFAYGIAVGLYRIFPFNELQFAKQSVEQLLFDDEALMIMRPVGHVSPARYEGSGVVRHDPALAAPGVTLLAAFHKGGNGLRLIGPEGNVINYWPVNYRDIWGDSRHIEPSSERPATDWNVDIESVLALPDGSVIFSFGQGGLVKMDRCGELEWKVPRMTHHSIERAEGGGFWVPGRRYVTGKSEFPPLITPYFEEQILRISEDGKVLQEISLPGLFYKNGMQAILLASGKGVVANTDPELTHLNDVEELTSELAQQFPQFAAGDLIVSMRDFNLVLIMDPRTEKIKWYQTGPWLRQHDPDFHSDGRIFVFNNNRDDTEDGSILGGSNIIALDPKDRSHSIVYGADDGQKFFTNGGGRFQILDNGNLLITEKSGGRLIEVTQNGEMAWEFINRYDDDLVVGITQAIRYPTDYFQVEDWTCN
ncbi:MAG: arylsulfotransferase family protein [Rhizobiaceae bacterium]